MTNSIDLKNALSAAHSASEKARKLALSRFRTHIDIELKGYADFVTELDRQCEDVIRQELANFDQSIAFMGEESSSSDLDGDKTVIDIPDTCWIVDPIDGTSNYSHGFEVYGIAISLRVDNELVACVFDEPSLQKTYSAIKGQGAFVSREGASKEKISVQDRGTGFNLFGMSIPFWHPEYLDSHWEIVTKMFSEFHDGRRTGSAACDLAWMADGTYGGYFARFLKPWDVAAGGLLIREAGGIVSDWDGDDDRWLDTGKIVASASARLHDKMLSLIK